MGLNCSVPITPKACISSKRSFVYHQGESLVYHHCERRYSLRLMIYTFGDDIPLLSQWIKKFDRSKLVEFFGEEGEILSLRKRNFAPLQLRIFLSLALRSSVGKIQVAATRKIFLFPPPAAVDFSPSLAGNPARVKAQLFRQRKKDTYWCPFVVKGR